MMKKTISIDENAFNIGGSPRSRRGRKGGQNKTTANKISSPINKKHKKELLNKIRNAINKTNSNVATLDSKRSTKPERRENANKTPKKSENKTEENKENKENELFDYFSSLKNKHQKSVETNSASFFESLDQNVNAEMGDLMADINIRSDSHDVEVISLPSSPLPPAPILSPPTSPLPPKSVPYGILKGGTKPTYRTWKKHQHGGVHSNLNKTRRKYDVQRETRHYVEKHQHPHSPPSVDERSSVSKLNTIRETLLRKNSDDESNMSTPHTTIKVIKKTFKKKVIPGKSKTTREISVVVPNDQYRADVKKGINELLDKPITEIKRYLRERNIMRPGSLAPNVLMRQMYLQNQLGGGGDNTNKDAIVENFIHQ